MTLANLPKVELYFASLPSSRFFSARTREKIIKQEQCLWCWAAVAQLILAIFDRRLTQCVIATLHFKCRSNKLNCCHEPADCDMIESIQDTLDCHGEPAKVISPAKKVLAHLRQDLGQGVPVCLRLLNGVLNMSHFVAITGVTAEGVKKVQIEVQDPSDGTCGWIPSSNLLGKKLEFKEWKSVTHVIRLCRSGGVDC